MGGPERSGGRLVRRLSAVVVLVALVAAACGRNDSGGGGGREGSSQASSEVGITRPSASQPKDGGKLIYGLEAETDGFNPARNRFAVSGLIIGNAVFDPLVAYDADGNTQPYLAESIKPSDDYRTWTIKLRPGIVFHNGQKADAAALKKFIDALKASALTGAAARPIQEARIVDELTVDVVMNQPWVAFPATIVGQAGFLPAPAMLDDPDGMSGHPIGTGPFVFKEWVPGNRFVATKNTSYWRAGMPHLDEVEFRPLPDVQARIQSLQSGTVNMIHFSQPNYLPDIKAAAQAGDLQYVIASGEDDETFILLNMDSPPLDDLKIRQALVYATDVDQYLSLTKTDPGQVADSFLTKQSRWYSDPGWPKYDPAKAKQLVDEYKADHGGQAPKIVLTTSTAPEVREIGQALEQNWEAVGIDVSLNSLEQTQFIATALGGNYQANLWRQYSSPDPDAEYHWWISTNAAPIGTIALNFPRLRDEQVDEALNTGRTNPDPEVRKQAYARLQKRFAEIVPVVWLAHTRWVIAADNNVRDILNGPLPDGKPSLPILAGVTRLSQTWLDR